MTRMSIVILIVAILLVPAGFLSAQEVDDAKLREEMARLLANAETLRRQNEVLITEIAALRKMLEDRDGGKTPPNVTVEDPPAPPPTPQEYAALKREIEELKARQTKIEKIGPTETRPDETPKIEDRQLAELKEEISALKERVEVTADQATRAEDIAITAAGLITSSRDSVLTGRQPITEGGKPCKNCKGTGYIECEKCHGKGVTSKICYFCGGRKKDADGNECVACKGTGRRLCTRCLGEKRVKCPECLGTGRVAE